MRASAERRPRQCPESTVNPEETGKTPARPLKEAEAAPKRGGGRCLAYAASERKSNKVNMGDHLSSLDRISLSTSAAMVCSGATGPNWEPTQTNKLIQKWTPSRPPSWGLRTSR